MNNAGKHQKMLEARERGVEVLEGEERQVEAIEGKQKPLVFGSPVMKPEKNCNRTRL